MSRDLPAHPNLDHLRKQAKDLLRDLERRNPGAKLADALHTVAREYGFANWPKLKAHVESVTRQVDAAAASAAGSAPAHAHPFVGHWTADLSKSRRHPSRQFQSATLEFAVAGDAVTISDRVVEAWGQEEHSEYTIQADGQEHPSEDGGGHAVMARWLGSRILETVAKQDGQVVGRGRYELSADGTTLTVSATNGSENAHGWRTDFEQVIVLQRK